MSTTPDGAPTPPPAGEGSPSSPRREQMLSELAAELRAARAEHHKDITRLGALVAESATLLSQVLPRVSGLDEDLADLAARIDDLTGPDPEEPTVVSLDWPSLSAAAAAKEWEALAEWVAEVLGPFYEITREQLPDCWALHRPAVIELVWLRRSWAAAHAPDALSGAAGEWHTRWRRDALANIRAAIPETWCRPGEHYVHARDRDQDRDQWQRDLPAQFGEAGQPHRHTPGQRPDPSDPRVGEKNEIIAPRHWEQGYRASAAADLAWRRERDAARAAAAAANVE
ncbi:MAG: hypothetical protein L0I76_22085 [Pseudonocardia sp.]|nr:hypothetical protein [Pseudonocardia sp.]